MLEQVQRRWSRRRLAGDARAGAWVDGQVRRRQLRTIRDAWRFLVGFVAFGAAVVAALALLVTTRPFVRGLIVGGGAMAVVAIVAVMVLMISGTAALGMGAVAERWTSGELRPLRRRGWGVVNHLLLRGWDIDHVVVGPAGVFALETKWSGVGWQLSPPSDAVRGAVTRVAGNARDLRLWHEVRRHGVERVDAALFLWTAGDLDVPELGQPVVIDGVTVITGVRSASRWRADLARREPMLSADQIEHVMAAMARQAARRDQREALTAPASMSWTRMYWNTVGVCMATMLALLVAGLLTRLPHAWGYLPALSLSVAAGFALHRMRPLRIVALGWIAASLFGLIGGVIAVTW